MYRSAYIGKPWNVTLRTPTHPHKNFCGHSMTLDTGTHIAKHGNHPQENGNTMPPAFKRHWHLIIQSDNILLKCIVILQQMRHAGLWTSGMAFAMGPPTVAQC